MAWNGANLQGPNWQGETNTGGGDGGVGDLYITPDPPNTSTNPSIGLQGRNEVPLPLAYRDFAVDDLTATTINGNPNFDASNWWRYPANGNVTATLLPNLPIPVYRRQYDITDFRDINAGNLTAQLDGTNPLGTGRVNGFRGGFNLVDCETIDVSNDDETGTVSIYGASKIAGTNALYVEGGTTLTGGGIVHGTTIGALQVGGIDTVRIDVLPAGMLLTSATFITITSLGATAVSGAGTLALAGGDYITYNSDEHRFINTSAGNDFTDILVGNIHPSYNGSANLRINGGGSGRGVELADTQSITLWSNLPIAAWVNSTSYVAGNKVKYLTAYYTCVVANAYTQPNIPIPNWVSASNYLAGTIVFSSGLVYRCSSSISGSTTPPASDTANWTNLGYPTNAITAIWTEYFPYASTITGDELSSVSVGVVEADIVGVDTLAGKTDPYLINVNASLIADAGVRVINNFNSIQLKGQPSFNATYGFLSSTSDVSTIAQDNSTGQIVITTSDGLTINTDTSTDFSAGDVVNLKNLTLTTALNPTWSDIITYAMNDKVEYDGYNWQSQIAGNVGNIPKAFLSPWLLSSDYVVGNVRYEAGINNAYLCIANVSGSTTPPSSDPTNWSFFQVGSNAEDVWYQMNAVVESTIVGDRLSSIQIGSQEFVNEAGGYLTISNPPEDNTIALIFTPIALTFAGEAFQMIAFTGNVNITSAEEVIISGAEGVTLASDNGNIGFNAVAGTATISSGLNNNITSTAGDVVLTGFDDVTLSAVNGDVNISSTNGDIQIQSAVGDVTIQAEVGLSLTADDTITITNTANDVSIVAGNNINLTAGTGDKVIVNSTLDLTDKNVINADTITGQGALTLATTGATNLNLSPDTGGVIVANKNLSMGGNPITNCTSVGNNGVITIASTTNSIFISPSTASGTGVVQITKNLDMATINAITNCIGLSSANALSFTANNGNVNLTATGSGNRILLNSDASMGNRTLFNFTGTNVAGIYGLTTQPLVLAGQQATPAVRCGGTLAMWQNGTTQVAGNSITGITTLNGRNIFSYGNFYNTATQTLGAINTATRVVMNTSANNNLITLDTTTNIGRITFTNAGVYHVVWNAYLIHGSGGTAKSCIWIRLNGTDVAGSGKTENNDNQQNETNMTSSSLINATANQYIEFFWAADSTTVPLTAIAASAPFPATPSFSCTISIVG